MKILIYNGCWSPNIGNAFVNLGIERIIRRAFPDATIYFSEDVSSRWLFYSYTADGAYKNNSFNISNYLDVDLVVWGGMILTREFVDSAGDILLHFSKNKVPVMLLGAGADRYDDEETDYVAKYLEKFELLSIITRDDDTYNMFSKYSFLEWKLAKGIDAAFFLSELDVPELQGLCYDVECFDRIITPYIDHKGTQVIYTHHNFDGGGYRRDILVKKTQLFQNCHMII